MSSHPSLEVAVVMRRERLSSPWQPWRWTLHDVVPNEAAFGEGARRIYADEVGQQRWLHPGYKVELFRDEAEGYLLNATSPAPCWFVLWRMEEEASVDAEPIARPLIVTLSYSEAARWMDAQETVEQVPAPADVAAWMRGFAEEHFTPEVKKRKRPESFRPLQDRFGNPVSISTGKKYGRGDGGG